MIAGNEDIPYSFINLSLISIKTHQLMNNFGDFRPVEYL